ncbi:hypothetical protein F5Y05DRAFT_420818 [Hypoxylon sp. FL0543]|nr:hypothetical protein F5Y05DRAFT_420818 [Hypoxylon sp. FL0543]
MEHHRVPRHSSSHGTLHSSYSQGRPAHGPSPVRPLHKPLRSVNENSVLLPSPGALESMLKTTTETGDIGIFSIRPVPISPQRKNTLSGIGQQYLSPRSSMNELHHGNNATKPSSYRDTTSEIISMYGSESHKSATSTLTPTSSEEVGQRSYSMTTYGSRHLSHHRSTTTLQSQLSGGTLQRPRSPFPYPTRLKRPGVRPASPALTEGGRIDYSRMVEIDRTSYRTSHGPPPPLGRRPARPLPRGYGPLGPPSIRTHSAASMASWNGPYRDGLDSFSYRTSSLTSVANMHHRFPNRAGPSNLSAAAPRYYDYTEAFEGRQQRVVTPIQPLAPVPRHTANYQRPLILQQSDDNLEIPFEEPNMPLFEPGCQSRDKIDTAEVAQESNTLLAKDCCNTLDRAPSRHRTHSNHSENGSATLNGLEGEQKFRRGSDIDMLPSQAGRDSMDTFNPSLDLDSKDAPMYRYTDYRSTVTPKTKVNSPERRVQVQDGGTPTIRSEQGVILRDDTQDEMTREEGSGENKDTGGVEEQIISLAQRNSWSRRSCSEPAKSPSKSPNRYDALLENQDEFVTTSRADSHYSKKDTLRDETRTTTLDGTNSFVYSNGNSGVSAVDGEESNDICHGVKESHAAPAANQAPAIAQKQKFRRHKRNPAIPRISTSSLCREDNEGFPYISPSCSTTPIVSPKPISPARQLKLKNSIPQLMKALPPVPGDSDFIPPPTPSIQSTSSDGDFSEVLAPFRFPDSSSTQPFKDMDVIKLNPTPNDSRDLGVPKHVPRVRLKTKMSNESGHTFSSDTRLCNTDIDHSWSARTPNPILRGKGYEINMQVRPRNRLKLRSSRSNTAITPPSDTVRRTATAESSNSIVDMTGQKPQDLFTVPPSSALAWLAASGKPSQQPSIGRSSRNSTSDKQKATSLSSLNTDTRRKAPYDSRSIETNASSNARHPHDLKRRWSNIRDMLVWPADSFSATSEATTTRGTKDTGANQNISTRKVNFATGRSRGRTAFGRRVQSQVFKWVRDAKTAVRACTKRKRRTTKT